MRPLFPRAVPLGCGAVSAALLVILFIGGAIVAHSGLGRLMEPLIGTMASEISTMYTKDVTPAERKALGDELTRLRENIRSGKVPVAKLDPVMSGLREAIRDQKITPQEAASLTEQLHALNTGSPAKPKPPHAAPAVPPR